MHNIQAFVPCICGVAHPAKKGMPITLQPHGLGSPTLLFLRLAFGGPSTDLSAAFTAFGVGAGMLGTGATTDAARERPGVPVGDDDVWP